MNDMNKIIKNIGKIIVLGITLLFIGLWLIISLKCAILTLGILLLLSYINIATTTLGNAFIGRNIDTNYDIFWKMLLILFSSICFGIYFNI